MVDRLYRDQLELTERHLDALVDDANGALALLTSLSASFQAVEAQTTSFHSHCEGLVSEQRRLQQLADDVGTDLHYYAYLDTATRRLNAPGASRLVDDASFGDMMDNIDSCIKFMDSHVRRARAGGASGQREDEGLLTSLLRRRIASATRTWLGTMRF